MATSRLELDKQVGALANVFVEFSLFDVHARKNFQGNQTQAALVDTFLDSRVLIVVDGYILFDGPLIDLALVKLRTIAEAVGKGNILRGDLDK